MGNKSSSPFPSYDSALTYLNPIEISHLKKNFKIMSRNSDAISLNNFLQVEPLNLILIQMNTSI